MLRIRLRRVGKKGKPSYRIVVAEATAPRDGAYVEWIGNYDPMVDPPAVSIKADRAIEWLGKGAQPSDAVRRILDWNGILPRTPTQRSATTKSPREEPAAPTPVAVAATPAPAAAEEAVAEGPADEAATEVPTEEITEEPVGEAVADEPTGETPVEANVAPESDEVPDEAPEE